MSTNVYAWPPVGIVGWELTVSDPVSASTTFPQGAVRTSSFAVRRRMATAVVPGAGISAADAGYMETLKDYLRGGQHLIRLDCYPGILHSARQTYSNTIGTWLSGSTEGLWDSGGTEGYWASGALYGTAGTSGGFPEITVSGCPANKVVCNPHELVSILAVDGSRQSARAVKVATSDGSGVAVIRLMSALTGSGPVAIGDTESIVFRVLGDLPRAVQPTSAEWSYTWNLREVFESEFDGGWVEVNPWA